jgi:hypothetical protein
MKLDTESRMDFDRTIGTEERFALRKWLQQGIDAHNTGELPGYFKNFSENLEVKGFTDEQLDLVGYQHFIKKLNRGRKKLLIRYPKIKIIYKHFLFHINGSFEGFVDGILCYEGNIEMDVIKAGEQYTIVRITFFPRMLLKN